MTERADGAALKQAPNPPVVPLPTPVPMLPRPQDTIPLLSCVDCSSMPSAARGVSSSGSHAITVLHGAGTSTHRHRTCSMHVYMAWV